MLLTTYNRFLDICSDCSLVMGQKISFNEDVIHSMKKLRLSGSNDLYADSGNVVIMRISDVPSPCSPVRKQSKINEDIMKNALNAPLETDSDSRSFNESTLESILDSVEHVTRSQEFAGDSPLLDGK